MTALDLSIQTLLAHSSRILIVSHIRPDGDAVGSLLALGLALLESGKDVQMVLADGLPASFRHLPGSDLVRTCSEGVVDLRIVLDCSDLERTGHALGEHKPDLVIDHHETNAMLGTLNLVETNAAATACILAAHLPLWDLPITASVAACLLTGILADTIGFRTPNTTPEVLRQAAHLVECGADLGALYYQTLVRRSFNGAKYWGAGLGSLQHQDGIVWASLTLADRQAAGYAGNNDDDLIALISAIEDASVAIMFVEQAPNRTKVSWRGLKPGVNVSAIAIQFGGGGHKAAAGAELDGCLQEIHNRVLAATRSSMNAYFEVELKDLPGASQISMEEN